MTSASTEHDWVHDFIIVKGKGAWAEGVPAYWCCRCGLLSVLVDMQPLFTYFVADEKNDPSNIHDRFIAEPPCFRSNEARRIIEMLLKSAHPHPIEHPTMSAAWKAAEAFLGHPLQPIMDRASAEVAEWPEWKRSPDVVAQLPQPSLEEKLQEVLTAPMGFYLRAARLTRLLTKENAAQVMKRLPRDFFHEYLDFARQVYAIRGDRLVIKGEPIPEACLEAFREWLRSYDHPSCPDCGGDLGGNFLGRIENHKSGCPRFPL